MKTLTRLIIVIFISLFFISKPGNVDAIEDPLRTPNNKIGIHILFQDELTEAAQLINTNGGDWGYVTIPIQINDRDLTKWQLFMDRAKQYHITPIVRLASEGDYFNTSVWREPSYEDVVDLANFLDSLHWPTKNRYIIVYNEMNRADEWGGKVDPEAYANLLSFAVTVFKAKSQDFFIINGGLDNAAPEEYPKYMNQYTYLRRMHEAVPGIFNQIDGHSSHAYPNPGFAQTPETNTTKSIFSFIHERNLIRSFRNSDIPIFITETGWNAPHITEDMKAEYYKKALDTVWNDPGIVAITPFLLRAGDGPFKGFSFLHTDGSETKQYQLVKNFPKVKGQPVLNKNVVLGLQNDIPTALPQKSFERDTSEPTVSLSQTAQDAFKWIMKL